MTNLLDWATAKPWTTRMVSAGILVFLLNASAPGETLEVGPNRRFARIEDANAVATAGDLILVYPRTDGQPYEQTAVMIRQPELTFRAVPDTEGDCVRVSGTGFDYSGRGQTPRAIFQFNRGADDCVLEGFELSGAHNTSHNGAGVRINQANRVTIRHCQIHHNDMGIMSNGDGTPARGVNQLIERCQVHHNGAFEDPGYNHNLYLGGTDVTLRFCEIYASLTGHNVKSRAHQTWVEYCYVHDSANREFDLVDAADTARPDSHAVIIGCLIAKDPKCTGNRGVVHFGQDGGGEHNGGIYLVHDSIIQPFVSPLVTLSCRAARAQIVGNVVSDGGARQYNQKIVGTSGGANSSQVTGHSNWFSGDFTATGGVELDPATNTFQRLHPVFQDPSQQDFRLTGEMARRARADYSAAEVVLPDRPRVDSSGEFLPLRWQYRHPASGQPRGDGQRLTFGAIATVP